MAQVVRRLVSGQKKRFSSHGFDLDLAYITPRLVAMGLPATGSEGLYRNPLDETARFLARFHGGRAKVWNLCSERRYDPAALRAPVVQGRYAFDDHQVPPLAMAQQFCAEAAAWLAEHPENVAVVHCKAGKGRTGLMLCCLMLLLRARAPDLANFPPAALAGPGGGAAGDDVSGGGGGPSGGPSGCSSSASASGEDEAAGGGGVAGGAGGAGVAGGRGGAGAGLWWRRKLQSQLAVDLASLGASNGRADLDVLSLYAERRTHDGKGVTIASQRRWVTHFWRALEAGARAGGGGSCDPLAAPLPPPPAPRPVRVRRIRVCGLPPGAAGAFTVSVALRPEWIAAGGGSRGGGGSPRAHACAGGAPPAVVVGAFGAPPPAAGAACLAPCRAPAVKVHGDDWDTAAGGCRGGGGCGGGCAAGGEGWGAVVAVAGGAGSGGGELTVTFPPGSLPLLAPPRRDGGAGGGAASADGADGAHPGGGLILRGDVKIEILRGGMTAAPSPSLPPPAGARLGYAWLSTGFLPRGAGPGARGAISFSRSEIDKAPRSAPPGLRLEIEYEEILAPPRASEDGGGGGGGDDGGAGGRAGDGGGGADGDEKTDGRGGCGGAKRTDAEGGGSGAARHAPPPGGGPGQPQAAQQLGKRQAAVPGRHAAQRPATAPAPAAAPAPAPAPRAAPAAPRPLPPPPAPPLPPAGRPLAWGAALMGAGAAQGPSHRRAEPSAVSIELPDLKPARAAPAAVAAAAAARAAAAAAATPKAQRSDGRDGEAACGHEVELEADDLTRLLSSLDAFAAPPAPPPRPHSAGPWRAAQTLGAAGARGGAGAPPRPAPRAGGLWAASAPCSPAQRPRAGPAPAAPELTALSAPTSPVTSPATPPGGAEAAASPAPSAAPGLDAASRAPDQSAGGRGDADADAAPLLDRGSARSAPLPQATPRPREPPVAQQPWAAWQALWWAQPQLLAQPQPQPQARAQAQARPEPRRASSWAGSPPPAGGRVRAAAAAWPPRAAPGGAAALLPGARSQARSEGGAPELCSLFDSAWQGR